ncbi:MAG TPA: hypothetical protein VF759_04865 [Allosphingosinicella sp.]|jgi:hypothetical protein
MSELKVAVIVDGGETQRFGLDAIDQLRGCDEITVFSCTNTAFRRLPVRHGAYYALNLACFSNRHTRRVPVTETRKRIAETIAFESDYEGAWQRLPDPILARLAGSGFHVIVKLGMGLLRVPPPETLPVPILAWHHGDPDLYRGRPAGFWEIVHGAPVMGQIVQILSNKLDGGAVVAFAETKVHPHSYRATLIEAYRHSHLLIDEAVRNALAGRALPKGSAGRNYRLPSNLAVLGFVLRRIAASAKRMFYGALVEKRWRVSVAPLGEGEPARIAAGEAFPAPDSWRTLPTPPCHLFLADPFFSRDPPGILVEALDRRSALGEILLVAEDGDRRLSNGPLHFSYPGTIESGGEQFVVPEMAQWGEQGCFRIGEAGLEPAGTLEVEGRPRLIDPTLVRHEGRFYLFGNDEGQGAAALQLWTSETLHGPYRLHPFSPVRISPMGGRMAGGLLRAGGRLIRFGQNFSADYGDGVLAFEIETLDPAEYRERPLGAIGFRDRQGPHTVNFDGGRIVFDWYHRRFSALSGVRRARARLTERRARGGLAPAPRRGG